MTTLVIGAGLAGLTAALMLKKSGEDVTIISHGLGSLSLSDGTLSIYDSPTPLQAIGQLPDEVNAYLRLCHEETLFHRRC